VAKDAQGGAGAISGLAGKTPALFYAEGAGKGLFAAGGVLAAPLAEVRGGGRHVQQIVSDLEGQAQIVAVAAYGVELRVCRSGGEGSQPAGGLDQPGGLEAMDSLDQGRLRRLRFAVDVLDLAGDHAAPAGGVGEFGGHAGDRAWRAGLRRDD